jgi:non-homologous end joining protein Ku
MAARPLWSGQLRLSLVSLAVDLYSATKSGARISFRQIHEPSGKRIRYEKVVPGIGPVDKDEIMKGYELEKDQRELIERKRKSKSAKKITQEEEEAPPSTQDNVIDLMAALKKSLEGTPGEKARKKKSKKKAASSSRKSTSRKKKRA